MSEPTKLTELQRAERVLTSQGMSRLLARTALASYLDRLAELCSAEGVLASDAKTRFAAIWQEHVLLLNEQKATDETTDLEAT